MLILSPTRAASIPLIHCADPVPHPGRFNTLAKFFTEIIAQSFNSYRYFWRFCSHRILKTICYTDAVIHLQGWGGGTSWGDNFVGEFCAKGRWQNSVWRNFRVSAVYIVQVLEFGDKGAPPPPPRSFPRRNNPNTPPPPPLLHVYNHFPIPPNSPTMPY